MTTAAAYIVTSGNTKSSRFMAREVQFSTLAEAEEFVASETADGWIAWINEIEIEIDTDPLRVKWEAERKALRAAEAAEIEARRWARVEAQMNQERELERERNARWRRDMGLPARV
jgi:hypothetical protein